jgi:DNA polymerase-3 subunit delta'
MGFMKKFSPYVNGANIVQFSEEFNLAIFHIERNANSSLVLLDLSLTVAKLLKIKQEVAAS